MKKRSKAAVKRAAAAVPELKHIIIVALAKRETSYLELIDLLVLTWEVHGVARGNIQVGEAVLNAASYWITQPKHRARAEIKALLKPFDKGDLGGVKETYRELTGRGSHGGSATSFFGFSKNRRRNDVLDPRRQQVGAICVSVQLFHQSREKAMFSSTRRLGIQSKETTRERRQIAQSTENWQKADDQLLRESLAGNDEGGVRTSEQARKLLDAWTSFAPIWFLGELSEVVASKKSQLIAARPRMGKRIGSNGGAGGARRPGRPRKNGPRGAYRPRQSKHPLSDRNPKRSISLLTFDTRKRQ